MRFLLFQLDLCDVCNLHFPSGEGEEVGAMKGTKVRSSISRAIALTPALSQRERSWPSRESSGRERRFALQHRKIAPKPRRRTDVPFKQAFGYYGGGIQYPMHAPRRMRPQKTPHGPPTRRPPNPRQINNREVVAHPDPSENTKVRWDQRCLQYGH